MMNLQDAKDIARLATETPRPQMMSAIRVLRSTTGLGLIQAKTYIEEFNTGPDGHDKLFDQLCDDFVQAPEDILVIKRQQLDDLEKEIIKLEDLIREQAGL